MNRPGSAPSAASAADSTRAGTPKDTNSSSFHDPAPTPSSLSSVTVRHHSRSTSNNDSKHHHHHHHHHKSATTAAAAAVTAEYVDPLSLPEDARRTVLGLMCILKVATSFDAGAFSLALGADSGIAQILNLDDAQMGFLGSSVYLGNVVGCACCAWLFQRHSAKYLLNVGMLAHAIFTVLFAVSNSFFFAVLARIGIGFTLSFVVVYSVVWADVFSPPKNSTLWLALLNIGVPVGTLAGFLSGGIVMNSLGYSWRWVFVSKALCMVPMLVFMSHVDPVMIDDPGTRPPPPSPAGGGGGAAHTTPGTAAAAAAAGASSNVPRVSSSPAAVGDDDGSSPTSPAGGGGGGIADIPIVRVLADELDKIKDHPAPATGNHIAVPQWDIWNSFLSNHLMILNVAGLSVLYFVVTGMQVFFTKYLREPPFSATVTDIMLSFGFTAVSAPIVGVAVGGVAMDKYGNYREQPAKAATMGAIAGTLAAVFGVFTTISTNLTTLSVNLWIMLFFGAAALPSAMGLIVASVPPDQKNAASSFANIMFNVWGYFAGPMFTGVVAQHTNSLRTAIGVTLNLGWLGVIFFWWSAKIAGSSKIFPASPRGEAPRSAFPSVAATTAGSAAAATAGTGAAAVAVVVDGGLSATTAQPHSRGASSIVSLDADSRQEMDEK